MQMSIVESHKKYITWTQYRIGDSVEEITFMSAKLRDEVRIQIVDLLKKNKKDFSCLVEQMPNIHPNFMCYRLNIQFGEKPIC